MIHFLMQGQERQRETWGRGAVVVQGRPCEDNYCRHVHDTLLCVPRGQRSYLAQDRGRLQAASRQPSILHCLLR